MLAATSVYITFIQCIQLGSGLANSEFSTHLAIGLLAQDTGAGLLMCCEEVREQGEAVKDAFEEEHGTFRQESIESVASDLVDSVEQR